jgi:hypothetical protein
MLHCSLPLKGLSIGEGGTVRGRFDAVLGRQESNVIRHRARREMRRASDLRRHVGLRDDILCGFAFLRVAARGKKHARVVGHMSHECREWGGTGGG